VTSRRDDPGSARRCLAARRFYLDDIHVYLRARANNVIPGGRPPGHEDKPEAAKQAEASSTEIK
jgi:hypothetical protein